MNTNIGVVKGDCGQGKSGGGDEISMTGLCRRGRCSFRYIENFHLKRSLGNRDQDHGYGLRHQNEAYNNLMIRIGSEKNIIINMCRIIRRVGDQRPGIAQKIQSDWVECRMSMRGRTLG